MRGTGSGRILGASAPPAEAEIYAPEFPPQPGVAERRLPADETACWARHAVLVEFWDFARVNSLRTMPYLKAWHERYAEPACA